MKNRNIIFTMILLVLACFGSLSPNAFAVSPPPDGGYAGGNTAEGQNALLSLTTGGYNTAAGFLSLESNTAGNSNTAIGAGTLLANTGDNNTATGAAALLSNTTGSFNTADGFFAFFSNTTGFDNTAIGDEPLFNNTIGVSNTGIGGEALLENTEGNSNTAAGREALRHNTTRSNNTAIGVSAGEDLTTGDNNIDIGFNVVGVAGEANTIRIGNTDITDTFISGISGATASGGAAVFVNGNGKLGTMTSSARFKDEIKPMERASEALLALKPVTFRYKKGIDPQGIPQFGLVAEKVEKVNPNLVVRDKEGKPYSVRYEQVNAMLLNEFLKEHNTVQELKKELAALTATVKDQAAQIEKVSARLEVSKPAAKVVLNNP
jgi:hypothetical protein